MCDVVLQMKLPNCQVTDQEVHNTLKIFGSDIGSLEEQTTRRTEPHVQLLARRIPSNIMKRHRDVFVCYDLK